MSHLRRIVVLGGIGAAFLGGLIFVSVREEPIPVDLAPVTRGDLVATVDVDGVTRVADLYEIAAPIQGVAQRAPVAVGDRVVAGETVVAMVQPASPALLDRRTRLQAEAAVREAEAALFVAESDQAQAQEAANYAEAQYERAQALVERGVAPISRLEEAHQARAVAVAALEAAEARIQQAQGALDRAEAGLVEVSGADAEPDAACCVEIRAPVDGVVLEIDTVSERPVTAGTRLLTVGDPADLEIVADLLSADAVPLAPGTRASVERWGGPPLEARLLRVEPTARTQVSALGIEEQRVDAIFEFTSPMPARAGLGHGFAVFLRVVSFEVADTLMVPLSATFRVGDQWSVFRLTDDGRVERVAVSLGPRNARQVAVEAGLSEGDRVVVHPNEALTDGAAVVERTAF